MKHYVVKHPTESRFVEITHGEQGYVPVDYVRTDEMANGINAANGVMPAEVQAALNCSMFNCWSSFEKLAEALHFEERTTVEVEASVPGVLARATSIVNAWHKEDNGKYGAKRNRETLATLHKLLAPKP